QSNPFGKWYRRDEQGRTLLVVPDTADGLGAGFVGHPSRPEPVVGTIQDQELQQYDFTPAQYESLVKLTATLCKLFPKINCDYPRDASHSLITRKLPDAELEHY